MLSEAQLAALAKIPSARRVLSDALRVYQVVSTGVTRDDARHSTRDAREIRDLRGIFDPATTASVPEREPAARFPKPGERIRVSLAGVVVAEPAGGNAALETVYADLTAWGSTPIRVRVLTTQLDPPRRFVPPPAGEPAKWTDPMWEQENA